MTTPDNKALAERLEHAIDVSDAYNDGYNVTIRYRDAKEIAAALTATPSAQADKARGEVVEADLVALVAGPYHYHHKMDESAEREGKAFDRCRELTIQSIRTWCATRRAMFASTTPQPQGDASGQVSGGGEAAGLEAAARFVEQRRDAYDEECGITCPETGAREYPGDGDEYVAELDEIAEGIRALATLSAPQARPDGECATCEPAGVFSTEGHGPFDCYACGKLAWPDGEKNPSSFLPAYAILVQADDGSLVVRCHFDGSVEFGEGITPDAAAREFWHRLGANAPIPTPAPDAVPVIPAGVLVSVDVSTGDDDAEHRIFARTTGEVLRHTPDGPMPDPVILCIEESRNFGPAPDAVAELREQVAEGKAQWDRVAKAIGADGDDVDDVFAKADAVARLVEADREYDAADEAWESAPGNIQAAGDTDGRDYDGPEFKRLVCAIDRRAAALRHFTAAQPEGQP